MEISFSIIIPLYNKAPYIERAINSVLNQSLQNFEIIVVNDGSSDGGEKIVTKIVDERLKLVSQKNAGVSAARNTGAKEAQYEYLAFLDGDDTYEPNFLSEIVKLIGNFPNAGIYGTSNSFIYPNGKKVKLGDKCTVKQAEDFLKHDLDYFVKGVNRLVGIKIHQLMFDSLVCFAYNVGIGNLQASTLLKKINLNKLDEVPQEFLKWNKATVNGELTVLNGLTKRREAERDLFLQGLKELEIKEIIGG